MIKDPYILDIVDNFNLVKKNLFINLEFLYCYYYFIKIL